MDQQDHTLVNDKKTEYKQLIAATKLACMSRRAHFVIESLRPSDAYMRQ